VADPGYFPAGVSVLRRVHEQRAVGLHYGQRALCIGALKPLNYIGTSLHSNAKERPFHRLAQTGKMFETVFFGSRADADRILAAVHGMHERVSGVLPEAAGVHPAGTPYSAFDPEMMLWTIAAMADSAQYFYELLIAPLTPVEREGFWQDYVRFGELFGMPREAAPPTYTAFRAWWDRQLAGDDLHLTDEARFVGHATAFRIPLPLYAQPGKRVHDLIMLGSLPPRVREFYGLTWSGRQQRAFGAIVAVARATRPLVPQRLARGRNTRSFELVADTEKWRIAHGRPTPQVA
jgi:uncharacterized protein (DUF2236 family)